MVPVFSLRYSSLHTPSQLSMQVLMPLDDTLVLESIACIYNLSSVAFRITAVSFNNLKQCISVVRPTAYKGNTVGFGGVNCL
jgi:hypothetical protein